MLSSHPKSRCYTMKRGTDLPRLRMEAVRGPLDVDAAISPRHMREPLSLSLHLIEVSHISIRKSSITLRYSKKLLSQWTPQKYIKFTILRSLNTINA